MGWESLFTRSLCRNKLHVTNMKYDLGKGMIRCQLNDPPLQQYNVSECMIPMSTVWKYYLSAGEGGDPPTVYIMCRRCSTPLITVWLIFPCRNSWYPWNNIPWQSLHFKRDDATLASGRAGPTFQLDNISLFLKQPGSVVCLPLSLLITLAYLVSHHPTRLPP